MSHDDVATLGFDCANGELTFGLAHLIIVVLIVGGMVSHATDVFGRDDIGTSPRVRESSALSFVVVASERTQRGTPRNRCQNNLVRILKAVQATEGAPSIDGCLWSTGLAPPPIRPSSRPTSSVSFLLYIFTLLLHSFLVIHLRPPPPSLALSLFLSLYSSSSLYLFHFLSLSLSLTDSIKSKFAIHREYFLYEKYIYEESSITF